MHQSIFTRSIHTNCFSKWSRFLITAGIGLSLFFSTTTHAVDGALPGGTAISVDIAGTSGSPDTTVFGTASVEQGDPIKDTTVVYVVDISNSMNQLANVDCAGGSADDDRIVCVKEALFVANQAASDPFSAIGLAGLVSFNADSYFHDVDYSIAGVDYLAAPTWDGGGAAIPDIEEEISSLTASGSTDYYEAMVKAIDVLNDSSNTNSANLVIFLSDGFNGSSTLVAPLAASIPAGTTIKSFAIGEDVSCTDAPDEPRDDLQDIANLSNTGAGECKVITDMSKLGEAITQSIGSSLNELKVKVDGDPAVIIDNTDIDPDLPHDGPISVNYATSVGVLTYGNHEICVTAYGADAGGNGNVTDCTMIDLTLNVDIDIKPGSYPNSINVERSKGVIPVAIFGSDVLDVSYIDRTSLRFGPDDATPKHRSGGHLDDINNDGYMDLVSHYPVQDTGLVPGDASACVRGMLMSGVDAFVGCDSVRTVPVN